MISAVAKHYFEICSRSWSSATLVSRQHTIRLVIAALEDKVLTSLTRDDIAILRDSLSGI